MQWDLFLICTEDNAFMHPGYKGSHSGITLDTENTDRVTLSKTPTSAKLRPLYPEHGSLYIEEHIQYSQHF